MEQVGQEVQGERGRGRRQDGRDGERAGRPRPQGVSHHQTLQEGDERDPRLQFS